MLGGTCPPDRRCGPHRRTGEVRLAREAATPKKAAEKTDSSVEQLISDLGNGDYRVREKAGRDLVALGEKVLPQLRTALRETDSPEVQRRLAVMVRKMDAERLTTPRCVTASLKDKSPKAALDEIAKQTGYKIEYSGRGNNEGKHSFEFDKTPFWTAVDTVANAAGCVVYAEYDDSTIRVYNQDALNPHIAYAGPFRFIATSINSNRSVQLSGVPRRGAGTNRYDNMNLSFQIQSEPKNPMLGVLQPEVISAVDEFGGIARGSQERQQPNQLLQQRQLPRAQHLRQPQPDAKRQDRDHDQVSQGQRRHHYAVRDHTGNRHQGAAQGQEEDVRRADHRD